MLSNHLNTSLTQERCSEVKSLFYLSGFRFRHMFVHLYLTVITVKPVYNDHLM